MAESDIRLFLAGYNLNPEFVEAFIYTYNKIKASIDHLSIDEQVQICIKAVNYGIDTALETIKKIKNA